MDRDSNLYTFLFAAIMVLVVATVLAFTSQSLKDLQNENVRKEKMQNILSTVGIMTDRDSAEVLFNQYIEAKYALKNDGSINESIDPFSQITLALELKKSADQQNFPLYVANIENSRYYIIPIRGNGLWNATVSYTHLRAHDTDS